MPTPFTIRAVRRARAAIGLLIAATVVLVSPSSSVGQTSSRIRHRLNVAPFDPINPRGPYLGQRPPGTIPEVFAPGFISSAEEEYAICFSMDGSEIYFSRYTETDDSNTLWVTRQTAGTWAVPIKAEFTGPYFNIEAFITRDNARMYFISLRGGGATLQLWTMSRAAGGWSVPTRLAQPFSNNIKMYPTVATNGNLYFTEVVNDLGRFYMARNNGGTFATPLPLNPTINAFGSMDHAFVGPDESYLVFDAAPNAPANRDKNIYVSFKGNAGDWLTPQPLTSNVNATAREYCPTISPDGKYLFFARRNGEKDDIWWVDARVVFDLRPAS